jgi:hypothetical protein
VDINGNIHVVWFEDDVTPNIVYTKWDGTSWSTPMALNQGVMGGHSLVADSLGRVHLIYIDSASGFLSYRVLNTSGSWSTPMPVSTQIPAEIQWPALAVDSSNNPHVVWPHHIATNNSTIYYSRWNSQAWSTPQPISNDAFAYLPRIAVDHTGIAHVVWEDLFSHLTYYWDSSNSSTPIQLSDTNAFEPDIATDNTGNVYVVWGNGGLYYRYLKGSIWSPVSTIVDTGGAPSLTADSAGNLQLTFTNSVEHSTGVVTQNGISWSMPTVVQNNTSLWWPAITASTIGSFIQIHTIWVDASLGGGNIDIFYSTAVDEQFSGSIMQVPTSGYIGFLFHQRLDSPFDCLEVNNAKRSHQGIDIWTNQEGKGTTPPSPKGHEVRAAHGGTLIAILDADNKSAVGSDGAPTSKASILVIDHGSIDGQPIYTLYAHMANADGTETFLNPRLRLGQSIVKGALLGHQGNTFGKASPNSQMDGVYITHLHFEVKESAKAGKQVDPSPYIERQVNRCNSGYPGFLTPFP